MEITAVAQWLNVTFASFDQAITGAVHQLYLNAGGFFTPFLEFISFLGDDGIALIIIGLLLLPHTKTRKYGLGLLLGIGIGALFTNLWLKVVIARPRPYVDTNGFFYPLWVTMGQHIESDLSFPSGHTTAAFAAMVPLFIMGNKRISWLALVFAVTMGISRIYLVVHYPSDVLGGILVGSLAGIIGVIICRIIPQAFYDAKIPLKKRKKGAHECS